LGSTWQVGTKLGETIKKGKFTPPSPIKATPTTVTSNPDDLSTTTVSNADDVMMMSSSQNKELLNNHSILPKKDPPDGKTTAIIAMMRGRPKDGYHCHCSNKHYKQKLVRVLLDSGSDSNLVFVNKDEPMLLYSSKRLVSQSWNTSNGIFQTKRKAGIELNFFKYSNSKRYFVEPDIVEYDENNQPQYDLIIGTKTMKEFGIILDFKEKMIPVDESNCQCKTSTICRALAPSVC
jgi:hypothetical protein